MTPGSGTCVRPGTQAILFDLKIGPQDDEGLGDQVLEYLHTCPNDRYNECWLDAFFALEILVDSGWNVEPTFALFVKAFPIQNPLEFVKWTTARQPAVALAFWRVLKRLMEATEGPAGNGCEA